MAIKVRSLYNMKDERTDVVLGRWMRPAGPVIGCVWVFQMRFSRPWRNNFQIQMPLRCISASKPCCWVNIRDILLRSEILIILESWGPFHLAFYTFGVTSIERTESCSRHGWRWPWRAVGTPQGGLNFPWGVWRWPLFSKWWPGPRLPGWSVPVGALPQGWGCGRRASARAFVWNPR